MNKWQPIATVPLETRVLVYAPDWHVIEAFAAPDGSYRPRYNEWYEHGATHWMPLPAPPFKETSEMEKKDLLDIKRVVEFAQSAPNDNWFELRVYFRKLPDGKADIRIGDNLQQFLPDQLVTVN